jgi:hypothetical protein
VGPTDMSEPVSRPKSHTDPMPHVWRAVPGNRLRGRILSLAAATKGALLLTACTQATPTGRSVVIFA